jgi:Uncharacterized protein conserved in bacteria
MSKNNTENKSVNKTVLLPEQRGIIDKAVVMFSANKKVFAVLVIAVLAAAIGFAAYSHNQQKAYQDQWAGLFKAELNFVSDQNSLAPLENFVEANPATDAAIYARLTLGNAYYQTQDYVKAQEYFKQVASGKNKELAALAEVSSVATDVAQKDYAGAIKAADAFIAKNPTHFAMGEVLQYKALAQELSGDAKSAKESYTKISMQYPQTYYSAFADMRLKELNK